MNNYQKIVLIFGALFLLITLIPSRDIGLSAFPVKTLVEGLGIIVVMCLFLYAFKDFGKKQVNVRKK